MMRPRIAPGSIGAVLLLAAAIGLANARPALAQNGDGLAAAIRRSVDSGTHPWLRQGRFADRQAAAQQLYAGRHDAPLWLDDGQPTPQAVELVASLFEAEARGLSPSDYDADRLRAEVERAGDGDTSPDDQALLDTALTVVALRYSAAVHSGRIDPGAVGFGADAAPEPLDLAAVVVEIAQASSPRERIAQLDPQVPLFARLKTALAHYRQLAAQPETPLPLLGTLRPGDLSVDLPALRARLVLLGDLDAGSEPAEPLAYDEVTVAAVRTFQRRHGLEPDAVIGKATLRALQTPLKDRVAQIELAMERLRWLPSHWPERFIIVNIPEFRLRGFDAGATPLAMNVVVGEAEKTHKTPVLSADMRYVVFRPYWSVPPGIMRREILPKVDRDPDYLERNDMEMIDGRVRQRPGRRNSLGLIKFIFPNPHHVYLHDTPSKGLFARSRRDFSHGCIRVADPRGLAEFVFAGQQGWNRARIDTAMLKGPDDRRVDLENPVPVYLLYTTVVVDEDGTVNFFEDIYGHDFLLASTLAKGYPYPS